MRHERRIALEDLAKRAQPIHVHRNSQRLEETHRRWHIAVYTKMRQNKRTYQPAPCRASMIGSIAVSRATAIVPLIPRLLRSKTPQAEWSEQMLLAGVDYAFLLFRCQRADWQ